MNMYEICSFITWITFVFYTWNFIQKHRSVRCRRCENWKCNRDSKREVKDGKFMHVTSYLLSIAIQCLVPEAVSTVSFVSDADHTKQQPATPRQDDLINHAAGHGTRTFRQRYCRRIYLRIRRYARFFSPQVLPQAPTPNVTDGFAAESKNIAIITWKPIPIISDVLLNFVITRWRRILASSIIKLWGVGSAKGDSDMHGNEASGYVKYGENNHLEWTVFEVKESQTGGTWRRFMPWWWWWWWWWW
jgi:hypothetical protein